MEGKGREGRGEEGRGTKKQGKAIPISDQFLNENSLIYGTTKD